MKLRVETLVPRVNVDSNPKPAPESPTSNLEFSYLTFGSKFTSGKSQFDEFERTKL